MWKFWLLMLAHIWRVPVIIGGPYVGAYVPKNMFVNIKDRIWIQVSMLHA